MQYLIVIGNPLNSATHAAVPGSTHRALEAHRDALPLKHLVRRHPHAGALKTEQKSSGEDSARTNREVTCALL
jgi:hypothetical protein